MPTARVSLAPINTGLYLEGNSTDANLRFFQRRSGNGIQLSMVGNIAISHTCMPNATTGVMSENPCWARLSHAIASSECTPGIQLSATVPGYVGQRGFHADDTDSELRKYREHFDAITNTTWSRLEREFLEAIALCLTSGFQHLQLHAAHGYLFALVMDPEINPNRKGINVLISILETLAHSFVGNASLRVSWLTGLGYDQDRQSCILESWRPFQDCIQLDLSNGYYNIDKTIIYSSHTLGKAPSLQNAIELAERFPNASFRIAGNIWNPYDLINTVPTNLNFGIGRALIADPDHLRKMKLGIPMLCNGCDQCHYYSTGQPSITCPKWLV